MKVLLINGSPNKNGCTYTALTEVSNQLNKLDIETSIFHIGNGPIRGCIGCNKCRENGRCIFDDDKVNECVDLINECDGVILGSPVYYASASGAFTAFLDRVFYAKKSYELKLGASVVSCRRGGASATFDQLNKYFTISSMPVVSSKYWNSVHGNTAEEVKQDLEGLQVMRTLANNMAWLLKCIELGKKSIPYPEKETPIATNFIR